MLITLTAQGAPIDEPGGLPKGYRLIWTDEFSGAGLPDPATWGFDTYRNRLGWWSKEKQYYANRRLENARVENGMLVIEAHREDVNRERFPDSGGQSYTSARLLSRGLRSWTYGFFEVRARLPCGVGSWPAIWMWSEPQGEREVMQGEIDIMEHIGATPGVILGSIHTWGRAPSTITHSTERTQLKTACSEFHRYQLTWTQKDIVIGVDDRNYARWRKPSAATPLDWPYDRPYHMILNIAIGGQWNDSGRVDDTIFPVRMEIDYVRVYQQDSTEGN